MVLRVLTNDEVSAFYVENWMANWRSKRCIAASSVLGD